MKKYAYKLFQLPDKETHKFFFIFSTLANPNSSSEMVEFDWLTDLDGLTLGEKKFQLC